MATSDVAINRVTPKASVGDLLSRNAAAVGGVGVLIVIIVVFSLIRPATFPTVENFRQILNQTAVGGTGGAGQWPGDSGPLP